MWACRSKRSSRGSFGRSRRKQSRRLPPTTKVSSALQRRSYYKQEYEAALEQCDHTIELNPHFSPAYWILGLVQEQRGEFDESAAAFQRAIQLSPRSPLMQAALGRTFALSGKHDEAIHILRGLQDLAEKRYVSPFELASLHFTLGHTDEGFQWLAKAFQDRCFELISLRVDPRWESLRENPRFHKLFDQLGLPSARNLLIRFSASCQPKASELNRLVVFVFDRGSTQAGRGGPFFHVEALGVEVCAFSRTARSAKLC